MLKIHPELFPLTGLNFDARELNLIETRVTQYVGIREDGLALIAGLLIINCTKEWTVSLSPKLKSIDLSSG